MCHLTGRRLREVGEGNGLRHQKKDRCEFFSTLTDYESCKDDELHVSGHSLCVCFVQSFV